MFDFGMSGLLVVCVLVKPTSKVNTKDYFSLKISTTVLSETRMACREFFLKG